MFRIPNTIDTSKKNRTVQRPKSFDYNIIIISKMRMTGEICYLTIMNPRRRYSDRIYV